MQIFFFCKGSLLLSSVDLCYKNVQELSWFCLICIMYMTKKHVVVKEKILSCFFLNFVMDSFNIVKCYIKSSLLILINHNLFFFFLLPTAQLWSRGCSLAHADKLHCRCLTSTTHRELTWLNGSQSGQVAKLQVGVQMISRRVAQSTKARWEILKGDGPVCMWTRLEIFKN